MTLSECAKKRDYVEKVYDVKEFKKLLRTRTNVLVLFMKTGKDGLHILNMSSKSQASSLDASLANKIYIISFAKMHVLQYLHVV